LSQYSITVTLIYASQIYQEKWYVHV